MQFLLDHIASVIISSILVIIIAGILKMGQDANVDATKIYATKSQESSFKEMLIHDLRNIGAGVPAGEATIIGYEWSVDNKYIEFEGIVDTSAAATPKQIRYRVVPADSITYEVHQSPRSVSTYVAYREEKVGGTYHVSGGSMPAITSFMISLTDSQGASVGSNLNDTRVIDISMRSISIFGPDATAGESSWEFQVRPPNQANR